MSKELNRASGLWKFFNLNIGLVFLSGFLVLFFTATIFPVINGTAKFCYSIAGMLILFPIIALGTLKQTKGFFDAKLSKSLWLIFIFGIVVLVFYFVQSKWVLGKYILDPLYDDQRLTLEKIRSFCKISYMVVFVADIVYVTILQASLRALVEDSNRSSFVSRAAISISLLIAFLTALNYIAQLRPAFVDLTTLSKYSLSDNGRQIIKGIDREVEVTGFFAYFSDKRKEVRYMLLDINKTNPKIKFRIVDAIKDKAVKEDKGIAINNIVLFEAYDPQETDLSKRKKKRQVGVTTEDDLKKMERAFISAILAVTQSGKKVYFSTNHGELSYSSQFPGNNISVFHDMLRAQGYTIKYLSTDSGFPEKVPKDADCIVILGPKSSFSQQGRDTLTKYLADGGRILLTLDPDFKADFDFLYEKYGFVFKKEKVLSKFALPNKPDIIGAFRYTSHPISKLLLKLPEKFRASVWHGVGYFKTAALKRQKKSNVEFFVRSTFQSWVEKRKNGVQDSNEKSQNYNIGVAIGKRTDKVIKAKKGKGLKLPVLKDNNAARLVVFADSHFITDQWTKKNRMNRVIAINSLKWVLEDEKIMGILPHKWQEGRITLTTGQENFVVYFLSLLWPALFFFTGFIYVKQTRKSRTRPNKKQAAAKIRREEIQVSKEPQNEKTD